MKKILFLMTLCCFAVVAMAQDEAKFKKAYDLTTEGVELYDQGKYKEAVKKFNASLKAFDKYAPTYYEKALALCALDNKRDARKILLASFKKCEENGGLAANYKLLGDILDVDGETRSAIDHYVKASELVDDDDDRLQQSIYFNCAIAYQHLAELEPDSCEEHSKGALYLYGMSLSRNPTHASSYYGYCDVLLKNKWNYTAALGMLGWFGFFGASHPRISELAAMPARWEAINPSEEERSEFGPKTTLLFNTIKELLAQETSEYGKVYDLFFNAVGKVAETYTDEPVPFCSVKEDKHDEFLYPLYGKMVREGLFEAFCHVVASRVEEDYIANANWMSKNKETTDRLVKMLNDGRYFDADVRKENLYGRVPPEVEINTADEAHAFNEDALYACIYYLNHFLDADDMDKTTQFIFRWSVPSPDVNIVMGDLQAKFSTEESFPYLVAYIAASVIYQLRENTKEMTLESYQGVMETVVWYYENNKNLTGANAELDRLSELAHNDYDAFLKEMESSFAEFEGESVTLKPEEVFEE